MAELVVGNVGTIVNLALKIKEAVGTVRQNKEECSGIAKCVARISALLKRLEEGTEIMMDKVLRDALEDVAGSFEEALTIVTKCQKRCIICRFFGARDMAKKLRRVQGDILREISEANLVINIHETIIMTHVQHAGLPPPPPSPLEQVVTDDDFTVFSLSELKAATNDFSDENIIGRGVSAVIYKGVLCNGLVVAIKKITSGIPNFDARLMFCHEFGIGVKLQHKNVKNVVKVLGYCIDVKPSLMQCQGKYVEAEERQNFLVLGYVPNGSLHNITEGTRRIDWSSCFRMIEEIAKCVRYLHEQHVVHMDLKPANILFDSDMNPVIIDFGLSKRLDDDDVKILVDDLAGTMGYMAPEYIGKGMVSTKSDVFAFGITLHQTISSVCCGRKEWDLMVQEAGGVKELLDPTLQVDGYQVKEIERCMQVALLCTQMHPKYRPTMADIVEMLNGKKKIPTPKKPRRHRKKHNIRGNHDTPKKAQHKRKPRHTGRRTASEEAAGHRRNANDDTSEECIASRAASEGTTTHWRNANHDTSEECIPRSIIYGL